MTQGKLVRNFFFSSQKNWAKIFLNLYFGNFFFLGKNFFCWEMSKLLFELSIWERNFFSDKILPWKTHICFRPFIGLEFATNTTYGISFDSDKKPLPPLSKLKSCLFKDLPFISSNLLSNRHSGKRYLEKIFVQISTDSQRIIRRQILFG